MARNEQAQPMTSQDTTSTSPKSNPIRTWIHRGFLVWAALSTLYLANSMRTQGVEGALLDSDDALIVNDLPPGPNLLEGTSP